MSEFNFSNQPVWLVLDDGRKIVPFSLHVGDGQFTLRVNSRKGDDDEACALEFMQKLEQALNAAGLNVEPLSRNSPQGDQTDALTILSRKP